MVTSEMVEQILLEIETFIAETGLELYWDGEPLDLMPYFRTDFIGIFYNAETDACVYNIPWRYYLVPQNKGSHDFLMKFGGVEYFREVIWVPGK